MKQKEEMKKIYYDELYDLLTSQELSWHAIIQDLIRSEQLDPWDIDLSLLTRKYLEKVKELEEANFFVSSKILLAAAILLRIKSELLLEKYIKSIDEILFNKPEKKEKPVEEIRLGEVSEIFPRTPVPRFRKVTLQELMSALNKAISTEQRRIRKEIEVKQAMHEATILLPRKKINISEKIHEVYNKIKKLFQIKQGKRLSFTELAGNKKEERIVTFLPLLHLDSQEKVSLEQKKHFDEIFINLNE